MISWKSDFPGLFFRQSPLEMALAVSVVRLLNLVAPSLVKSHEKPLGYIDYCIHICSYMVTYIYMHKLHTISDFFQLRYGHGMSWPWTMGIHTTAMQRLYHAKLCCGMSDRDSCVSRQHQSPVHILFTGNPRATNTADKHAICPPVLIHYSNILYVSKEHLLINFIEMFDCQGGI